MAIILLVCIVVATTAASAINDGVYRDWQQDLFDRMEYNKLQEMYPVKRSNYGSMYISPCAAAASNPVAAYASSAAPISPYPSAAAATPYHTHAAYPTAPAHQGYAPSHYGHPYYRSEEQMENELEMLGLSDMNHVTLNHAPMARSSYGSPASGAGQAASAPVVGVFSNANVGGCSVPLLVSCSPSIAHGQTVKAQPYYNSDAPSSQQGYLYRGVDDHPHREEIEGQKEMVAHSSPETSSHNSKLASDKHQ